MVNPLKRFYEDLYLEKTKETYWEDYEKRSKDFFHRYILFFLNPYKNTRHEIVRRILPTGQNYLDIGCWTGDSTIIYGALNRFKEVYGIEISEKAGSEAKERGIKVSNCDINIDILPYPNNFFDCISFMAVIEHLVDPYHILKEIKRVIKNDGILIIGTPNVASLSNRLRVLKGCRPRTSFDLGWDGGHLLYFTPKDLKELLGDTGFEVIGKYASGNLQWLRRLLFPLTGEFIFKCRVKSER